jgi:hypothetical protein
MYEFRNKLVCLSKQACLYKLVFITENLKATSLLRNTGIFRKLWIRNILKYRPLVQII